MAKLNIHGDWFRTKLTEKRRSQRQLARHLELDPAAITLMLRGERRMQLEEARSIAAFLGEPVTDVLRAAGLPLKDEAAKEQTPTRIVASASDDETVRELIRKHNELLEQAEKLAKAIAILK